VPIEGCRAVYSLSTTRAKCNNEQRCYLNASNSVFGNPCFGTSKYLNVVYLCRPKDPTYSLNICEGRAGGLSCPVGEVINVQQASYGRSSSNICPRGPHAVPKGGCQAVNSLSLVRAQCRKRQSCFLVASSLVFGDPCFGTYKYLNVTYSCRPKDPTYSFNICEGRADRPSCPVGKVINVQQASYGRSSSKICQKGPHAVPIGGCQAVNSLHRIREKCNNQQRCFLVASNSVYGDPCVGTYKYLNVVYSCLLKGPRISRNICQGRVRLLSCPVGKVMIVQQASYGRLKNNLCQSQTGLHAVPIGGCRAVNSLSLVRARCNYQQSCSLYASNLVFGDPCYGTYKYLNIVYYCQWP